MISEVNEILETRQNPVELFTYALKLPESHRQYTKRFKVFLDFLNFDVDKLEEQSKIFLLQACSYNIFYK